MNPRPRSAAGWTVSVFGALAFTVGVLGLVSPDMQFDMMGFEVPDRRGPGDYTPAVLATTSVAAVNMGVLYVLGAAHQWPGFLAFTVGARLFMGAGLAGLMLVGSAPDAFVGAVAWEWLGALVTAVAMLRERWGRPAMAA
ncbi:hypothetical protein [Nannocystis radixulma]|uniref:DUF4345 domain-containing protein n=1 Tax=Nannocystis radixulma TaxID=2995305 RepID=A0ABT5B5X3_9BACT|nr:hypothetical protein [Nannocystis radixulma]MDC0668451.1 hypothetical protein [Nannocystis radixulma]